MEIEKEYAKLLRKLVSKYEPRLKETDSDGENYEEDLVFSSILTETGYIAGQHEMIAENITQNIVKVRNIEIKSPVSPTIQQRLPGLIKQFYFVLNHKFSLMWEQLKIERFFTLE